MRGTSLLLAVLGACGCVTTTPQVKSDSVTRSTPPQVAAPLPSVGRVVELVYLPMSATRSRIADQVTRPLPGWLEAPFEAGGAAFCIHLSRTGEVYGYLSPSYASREWLDVTGAIQPFRQEGRLIPIPCWEQRLPECVRAFEWNHDPYSGTPVDFVLTADPGSSVEELSEIRRIVYESTRHQSTGLRLCTRPVTSQAQD